MLRWFCVLAVSLLPGKSGVRRSGYLARARGGFADRRSRWATSSTAQARVAGRAVAPAPPPGQITTLSAQLLVAVASAAGLEWTPPAGLTEIRVVRPGGMRATLPPSASGVRSMSEAAVRRGDSVTLTYSVPGICVVHARARDGRRRGGRERALSERFIQPNHRCGRHRSGRRACGDTMNIDLHMRRLALIALTAGAAGCISTESMGDLAQDAVAAPGVAYNAARRAAAPPQFAPVGTPEQLTGGAQQTMPQPEPVAYDAPRPNSLWRAGSRSFFNDQRASRIGDILTVQIEIDDRAELSNSSNRSRSASTSAGVSNFFGLEGGLGRLFGGEFDPRKSGRRGSGIRSHRHRARSIAKKRSSSRWRR